jgi:hypothetical protein
MSSSCEKMMGDFLDKAPGVDVTEDTIFSTQINAEKFLVGIYQQGMYTDLPQWNTSDGQRDAITACCDDEAENGAAWYWSQHYNNAGVTASNNGERYLGSSYGDTRRSYRWFSVRRANIFLERIDDVPGTDPDYIDQAKGQARFIRALSYFEMMKRYGGVPIVRKRLLATDELKIPRSTFKETVDFIVGDCDTAAALLPDKWPSAYRGKATKGAALMLKSRALLYAASPLFNTGTPYLNLPGHNDLICYGNFDNNRWQLAADAAKAVIDWAPTGGVSLITNQGVNNNYRYVWEIPDNAEIIMASKLTGQSSYSAMAFKSLNNFYLAEAGTTVTFNFVQKYEKLDGTPQTWNPLGGNNLNQMYSELDPRFGQTVAYNGSYWNVDFPSLTLWDGAVAPSQPPLINCYGGHWLHKLVPRSLTKTVRAYLTWNLYRLAEAYLSYAEALNEAQGPVPEAYNAVHFVRSRSGMPDFPAGLSKEQFRDKIRNERTIELAFEDHRFWDIMRWLIAENEGVMKGNMWGIKIYKQALPSTEFSWVPYVFETRSFNKNMYLHPFFKTEVDKGYLIQNPGW